MSHDIFSGSPEVKNAEEGASRQSTTVKNVVKWKEVPFIKVDRSKLDIWTYLAERHMKQVVEGGS